MKRILITGKDSFIGTSFEKYMASYGTEYSIETVDMISDEWRKMDFSSYDAVFHVAGIAHSDGGRISKEREAIYYSVNTDLTVEVARKAKADGARQFIFMSSAIVYGKSGRVGKRKHITLDTPTLPANCYGDSKLKAEAGIIPLSDESFNVVVLRPPMIYGKGGKGNFITLEKIAVKLPFFPYVKNERSMLYVDNLSELIRLLIENDESGVFFPQNREYTNTSEMVRMIGEARGKKVRLIKGFGWAMRLMAIFVGFLNKAFGNLTYDKSISEYKQEYRIYSLESSIKRIYDDREEK